MGTISTRAGRTRAGSDRARWKSAAGLLVGYSILCGCATTAEQPGATTRAAQAESPSAGVIGEWIVTLDRGSDGRPHSTLTMLKLPIPDVASGSDARVEVKQGSIPCEGIGNGGMLRLSPDGAWALVPIGAGSGVLQLVYLAGPQPAVIDTIDFESAIGRVSWRRDNTLVAVALPEQEQIAIIPISGSGFGEPTEWPMPGVKPVAVEWSPSGRRLAVIAEGVIPVGFFSVRGDATQSLGLRRISVDFSALPIEGVALKSGHWMPNEKALIVFGSSFGGATVENPAAVSIVSFDEDGGGRWLGGFNIAGAATASAMSPEGDLLAVVTVDFNLGVGGAISLFRVDPGTGSLEVADQVAVDGPPSSMSFDRAGSTLLTTDFERDLIRIWRIDRSGRDPQLVDSGLEVETGVAPHAVAVAP
jgi:hypothetical protein